LSYVHTAGVKLGFFVAS